MSYDGNKPATSSAPVAAEIRENFRALKEDNIVSAKGVTSGLDASKSASPAVGDMYISTDTGITYKCSVVNVWSQVANPGGILGSFKNKIIISTGNATADIDADELCLEDSSYNKVTIRAVNLSVNMATSGANGLDTPSEAANTIYYLWVIRKSADGTVAGLISASASSPTMPSGYDQKALVGCVGNNNSSNFITFKQTGNDYFFTTWGVIATNNTTPGSWTTIDLTPADMSTNAGFVPSALSDWCFGSMAGSNDSAIITNNSASAVSNNEPNVIYHSYTGAWGIPWEFNVITADSLFFACGGSGTKVYLAGFKINKLG